MRRCEIGRVEDVVQVVFVLVKARDGGDLKNMPGYNGVCVRHRLSSKTFG